MTHPPVDKMALRQHLRIARRAIAAEARAAGAAAVAQRVCDLVVRRGRDLVVAGYSPLADELDVGVALAALRAQGYRTALPVTQGRDAGLLFRLADASAPLVRSAFGVMEPAAGDAVLPDVVLVPLLGFDDVCQRIGYGAGHYDRTLAAMAAAGHGVMAIGVAFDTQRVDGGLPAEPHDRALDCIVTDKAVYWPA